MADGHDEKIAPEPGDVEQILEQQEKLERLMKEKFTKFLTIMFTDLKDSTAMIEAEGDLAGRKLLKEHNKLIVQIIDQQRGVFVKSIGDGTLSYFDDAQDAVRAAILIQQKVDQLNMTQKFKIPVLMRIGLHSGTCIVDKHDIFGDTVNTAARFESSANPGEICMSEDTYNALSDQSEFYCRFIKQITLKGKKEPYNAYKAFWNPREVETDKTQMTDSNDQAGAKPTSKLKLALFVLIPLAIVLLLTLRDRMGEIGFGYETRSISHSINSSETK